MPTTAACVICRRPYRTDGTEQICADCQRLQAYGVIVESCVGNGCGFDVLDALSTLMGHVTRLRRRHNRELADEQLDGQRSAREAYSEGRASTYSERCW